MGGLNVEKKQVEELLLLMQGAYPNMFTREGGVGKAQLRMWRDYLLEWDYEPTKGNLRNHIETSVYEPKVAEIRPHTQNYYSMKERLDEIYGEMND
jgi:hypothetical protein